MSCCRTSNIVKLRCIPLRWVDFEPVRYALEQQEGRISPFRQLREIYLSFENSGARLVSEHRLEAFDKFLQNPVGIRKVSLILDRHESWHHHALQPLWTVLLRQTWDNIESISLTGLVCAEQDFLGFIYRTSASLSRVTFECLRLHSRCNSKDSAEDASVSDFYGRYRILPIWLI